MATFIPTPGCVRVDMAMQGEGGQIHNILWFKRAAAWTEEQRIALGSALETWWVTNMKPLLTGTVALVVITIVNQDTQDAPSTTHIVNPIQYGTVAGNALPSSTPIVGTLRTALRGRSYRGRIYLSGIPRTSTDTDDTVGIAVVNQLLAALLALKTVIEGLGAVWVVVSKWLNKVPRATGNANAITAVAMDQALDNQRRRSKGRGV